MEFFEYVHKRNIDEFLAENNIDYQELQVIEAQVLDNLYQSMDLQEQKQLKEEHQVLMNEVAPLIAAGGRMLAGAIISGITSKLMQGKKEKEDPKEKEEDEELNKSIEQKGGIKSMLYKAIKTLGVVTLVAGLVFIGFQFDTIREFFPFLTPFIDNIGEKITGMASAAFEKVVAGFPLLVMWLAKKASDLGIAAAEKAYEAAKDVAEKAGDLVSPYVDPAMEPFEKTVDAIHDKLPNRDIDYNQTWKDPNGVPHINPETGERSFPIDTRTGMKHGDFIDPRARGPKPDLGSFSDYVKQIQNGNGPNFEKPKLNPKDIEMLRKQFK